MHKTLEKFNYPETLLKEFEYWVVVIRKKQITLGSMVLICKENAKEFSKISQNAFNEQKLVIQWIEKSLSQKFSYDKINYLMLMMIDKEVHYHVIPRYSSSKKLLNTEFIDVGWPGLPNFSSFTELNEQDTIDLINHILDKKD